jgi:hypothetical protein
MPATHMIGTAGLSASAGAAEDHSLTVVALIRASKRLLAFYPVTLLTGRRDTSQ